MGENRYLSIVDEVQDEDIANPRESVTDVFRRVFERQEREKLQRYKEKPRVLGSVPQWWPSEVQKKIADLGGKLKLLRTNVDLRREGDEMIHCAESYCPNVEKGTSFIASLTTPTGQRTTFEFTASGEVRQHYGARNSAPSQESQDLAKLILEEIKKKKRG